jgi:autotransporter translocation and assembly factor TamB
MPDNYIDLHSRVADATLTGSVALSGNLSLAPDARITANASHLILSSSGGSKVTVSGGLNVTDTSPAIQLAAAGRIKAGTLGGFLVGHQSTDGRTAILNNADTAIVYFDAATNAVVGQTAHLILSSSAGSQVKVSGALTPLRLTTATLLAGTDPLTGSLVWDDTRKTLKIYGPLGWCPILTGTAG